MEATSNKYLTKPEYPSSCITIAKSGLLLSLEVLKIKKTFKAGFNNILKNIQAEKNLVVTTIS